MVRRPPRERKVPGSNPAGAGIFSGLSHTCDLNIGTPVATQPGAWRYRVSAGTGRPGVSILWLGEMESLICSFCLSVAARKIVQICPWDALACCWVVKQPTNNNSNPHFSFCHFFYFGYFPHLVVFWFCSFPIVLFWPISHFSIYPFSYFGHFSILTIFSFFFYFGHFPIFVISMLVFFPSQPFPVSAISHFGQFPFCL